MSTILIIEDQPDMRHSLATILRMENYTVLTAVNGRDGLAMATQQEPDLVICDVMMPEMNGHEVLAAVRGDARIAATPFIFLTAKGEARDLRTGMNMGADDYLTKPVTASDLLASVAARLGRPRASGGTGFAPDFSSATPLEALGLTPREAEVLLWVAQGKSNGEISTILSSAENTVKKHMQRIFTKLGVESRNAAMLKALEHLAPLRTTPR
jgi:DNA-binding NarL/FixJ family response regulator